MLILILGLIVFLGGHSLTMLRGERSSLIARLGPGPYKGLYSIVALIGLVLIVYGYGAYRADGYIQLWNPPVWTRHLSLTLMAIAFVLFAAAYFPGRIKRAVKHPMLTAVKVWAFGHLLANGDLGSILLFGAFLAYAVIDRIAIKRRPAEISAEHGADLAPRGYAPDIAAVVIGLAAYFAFVFWLHTWLIGVPVVSIG